MSESDRVVEVLRRHRQRFAPVLPTEVSGGSWIVLDLGTGNQDLTGIDLSDAVSFSEQVSSLLSGAGAAFGIGRYDEDRMIYRHSRLFDDEGESRSVHLGIDLFVEAGTPVSAPVAGTIHSFADNRGLGDYGPTVILEHRLDGVIFFTLYGHLSAGSLQGLNERQPVAAGQCLGRIGKSTENGGWPPHLHFQVITDMLGKRGDFPGVAAPSQRTRFLELCPDPDLILNLAEGTAS